MFHPALLLFIPFLGFLFLYFQITKWNFISKKQTFSIQHFVSFTSRDENYRVQLEDKGFNRTIEVTYSKDHHHEKWISFNWYGRFLQKGKSKLIPHAGRVIVLRKQEDVCHILTFELFRRVNFFSEPSYKVVITSQESESR